MAFTQTNAQRGTHQHFKLSTKTNLNIISELQNRKILEELHIKKQLLLKQGAVNNLNSTTPLLPLSTTTNNLQFPTQAASLVAETHNSAVQQRSALHAAHSQSFAYYITQDSSFGNLILPVIPRFDK